MFAGRALPVIRTAKDYPAALFLGARVTVYVAEGDGESAYIAESMKKYYDFEIIYTN